METITKRLAKERLGFSTDVQLTDYLGTSKQAAQNWEDDEPLPDGRQWQLRALRSDLFPVPTAA